MLSILEGKINSVDYVTHMQTTAGTNMAAAEVVPDIPAPAEPQGEQGNHSTALAPADSTPPAEGKLSFRILSQSLSSQAHPLTVKRRHLLLQLHQLTQVCTAIRLHRNRSDCDPV